MDNVYFLLIGAALTAAGIVAFRESERVAVRAIAAAGFTVGGIMSSLVWSTHYQELDKVWP
jgi:hypothetical protein